MHDIDPKVFTHSEIPVMNFNALKNYHALLLTSSTAAQSFFFSIFLSSVFTGHCVIFVLLHCHLFPRIVESLLYISPSPAPVPIYVFFKDAIPQLSRRIKKFCQSVSFIFIPYKISHRGTYSKSLKFTNKQNTF